MGRMINEFEKAQLKHMKERLKMINRVSDNFEAFEMAFAMYSWLSHWYSGMGCDKYAAMSRMISEYKLSNVPSIDFDGEENWDSEYELAIQYYHELTEENWEETFEAWCEYMDTQWDLEAC